MPVSETQHSNQGSKALRVIVGLVLYFIMAYSNAVYAQTLPNTLPVDTNSVQLPAADSLASDSLASDSVFAPPTMPDFNGMDRTGVQADQASSSSAGGENLGGDVQFQAQDSLVLDLRSGRLAQLFGRAQVTHTEGTLSSGVVALNLDSSLVSARSLSETDTVSYPVLERESDQIRSSKILFNYDTGKGKFTQARINVPQGQLRGDKVKNTSKEVVFVRDGIYSPCDIPTPNYYIKARRMKVVDQEEIFFTDAMLYIMDIPYPFIFPFGYVPSNIEQRESGLLTPTYAFQNQNNRGLGVTNMGWFQYFNDYLTGQFSVDFFTSGSFNFDSRANYNNKAGRYNGSIQYGYSNIRGMEPTDPGFRQTRQQNFVLNHQQDISPFAKISANINLRTSQYNQQNSFDIDERAEVSTTSRINYSYRHPENAFSINLSANQSSNFATEVTTLTFPTATFRLQPLTPFQTNRSEKKWYESITINYDNNLNTSYNFSPIDTLNTEGITWIDALFDPAAYRRVTGDDEHFQAGLRHTASLNGNVIPGKTITGTASIRMNEYWYPSTIRRRLETDEDGRTRTVDEQVRGFAAARTFTSSLNFATTVYGISQAKIAGFEGFRHTLRPSLGVSFSPDFSDEQWGYFREVEGDTTGRTYSIFEGGIIGGPTAGRSQSLNLSINNSLEAKRVKRDTSGVKKEENIRLIDNLSLATNYNFAAERNKLGNLTANMRSNILNKVSINVNANFDFYQYDSLGVRTDDFLWSERRKPALLQSFSVRASASFNGGARGINALGIPYPATYDPLDQTLFGGFQPGFNDLPVEPLRSDWSFSINLDYTIRRQFNRQEGKFDFQPSATLNIPNIAFKLTPKWDFSTSIGYDFTQKELTPSRFNLRRQLECWNINFTMNPFGEFQFYLFTLTVTDTQMNSLFNKLPLLRNLQRSSTPINRLGF